MTCSTCQPLLCSRAEKGRGTMFGLISCVFEPDFDVLDAT